MTSVRLPDNSTVQVVGRAALIVAWAAIYQTRINDMDRGSVRFDIASGDHIQPSVEERFERQPPSMRRVPERDSA